MIQRFIKKEFLNSSKEVPVISLSGPRQSGKTTLAKTVFPSYKYINLEKPDERLLVLQDPNYFLAAAEKQGIIIDEAQRAPELFSYIQAIVDEKPRSKFILTGSQNFLLSKRINQTLAGRVRVLNLLPLSTFELAKAGYKSENYFSYILKGGYPRLYGTSATPQRWLPSYIQTYLERDVRDFAKIKELSQFQLFLKLCAARTGQIFNYTDVGNAVGVTDNTIRHWLSVLEASYIIYQLPPYFRNFGKRLIKSKKIYFYDTGLVCHLLGIKQEEQLLEHYNYGGLFENFIVSEVVKYFTNKGEVPNLYFWRESNGCEIDIVIERGAGVLPIEVKASQTPKLDFLKNIDRFKKLSKDSTVREGWVLYGGEKSARRIISWRHLNAFLDENL